MRLGGAVYGARVRIYGGWDGLLGWSVWAGGLGEGWVAYGLCPKSRGRRTRASPFEVHPAGKFQWHFTCGFDFRHSLWLPFVAAFAVLKGLLIVPVGTMGPFWPGDSPLQAVRGGGGGEWRKGGRVPVMLYLWFRFWTYSMMEPGDNNSCCGNYGSFLIWW